MGKKTWFKFPHNLFTVDPLRTLLLRREYSTAIVCLWALARIAEQEDLTGEVTGEATVTRSRINDELNLHYKAFDLALKSLTPHWSRIEAALTGDWVLLRCSNWLELQDSAKNKSHRERLILNRRESERVEKDDFLSTLSLSGPNSSLVSIPTNVIKASGIDFINTLDQLDVSELIKCYGDALVRKEMRQMRAFLHGQTADDLKSQPNTQGNLYGWLANRCKKAFNSKPKVDPDRAPINHSGLKLLPELDD